MGHNTMGRVSKAEVMEILAADGGWMTAGAIFNRAPGARALDDVGAVLRGLIQDSEVQEIHGLNSLEYALAGVALPQGHREPARVIQLDAASFKPEPLRSGPPGGRAPVIPTKPYARMPLPAPAPCAPIAAAPVTAAPAAAAPVTPSVQAPKEPEMPSSSTKPRGGNGETRQRVAELLAKNPEITPKEVGERLGLSGSTASYHMRGLAKAKPKKAAPKVKGAKAAGKAHVAPRRRKAVEIELDAELAQLGRRCAPIERLEEKQAVLGRLAAFFTGGTSVLLGEISEDLARVAA